MVTAPALTRHPDQPAKHTPGRAKCANCPKMAAIRRMVRGSDGNLYGSGCARKLGLIEPRPRRLGGTLTALGARIIPGTLFDSAREQTAMSPSDAPTTTARRFVIMRDDARILDGVEWPDGSCSIRWRNPPRSTVFWDSVADAERVHCGGDPNVSARLVWIDDAPPPPAAWAPGELAEPTR